ncbi:gliding motility lipoprotein GldD [Tamlana sp. 2_MG-2023]|uniref:gliding motility lipoprotein GldD n=1 Tax=unclassified Tamlana TaxID=2614803 RepID=UPI0026E1D3EB|nr:MULTISPECIES: gliding motility lipoprotein GldD [unclassified Tamlana]MDO6760573.1 gliding motility lipoprotein GldD [Tamlana sp. 2_MG-2023]MDO6790829.1 gliding motility lipoprotein GldD [Tamlana sp. 1_MG-2023]
MTKIYFLLILVVCFCSCKEDLLPKPKAFLRLEYPEAKYEDSKFDLPFTFEINTLATKVKSQKVQGTTESYGVNIEYPSLKGTLFLTYKSIDNDEKNLNDFLRDAQNFTQKHTVKADEIPVTPYENYKRKVYGAFAEVKGDVASPAQFYVTDSVNHFLTGSLYFYAKPNYDSILPAANYLQKDIRHIMETVEWK